MSRWLKQGLTIRFMDIKCFREAVLLVSTFIDASILPMPTSTYFTIISASNVNRVFIYFSLALAGTVAGSSVGFFLGHLFSGTIESSDGILPARFPFISEAELQRVIEMYSSYGFLVLLIAAATPIPYAVFSLSSGAAGTNFLLFILGTLAGQGLRFLFIVFVVRNGVPFFQGFFPSMFRPSQSARS